MVKVHYDAATGAILGFYPGEITYSNIPEPYIVIDRAAHQDCGNNQGRRKVDLNTKKIVTCAPPGPSLEDLRTAKLAELDRAAAAAYVGGFYSEANGARLYYDSDRDTQNHLYGIYARTKEADWDTVERYPGIAPAGKAPIRARPTVEAPMSAKTVQILDKVQIKQLVGDLDSHLFSVKAKLWQLQTAMDTAYKIGDADKLQAVKWTNEV